MVGNEGRDAARGGDLAAPQCTAELAVDHHPVVVDHVRQLRVLQRLAHADEPLAKTHDFMSMDQKNHRIEKRNPLFRKITLILE